MTQILCKVAGRKAMIIGYGPGEAGQPKAIIISDGVLQAVNLNEIELVDVPKPLRKKRKSKKALSSTLSNEKYDYQIRLA